MLAVPQMAIGCDPEPQAQAQQGIRRSEHELHRGSTRACCWRTKWRCINKDLADERCVSAIGLVHQRFSTHTFPEWPLAYRYRYVAHNGEIKTVARQLQLDAGVRRRDGIARAGR